MRIKNILVATFMVLISANIVAEQAPMKIDTPATSLNLLTPLVWLQIKDYPAGSRYQRASSSRGHKFALSRPMHSQASPAPLGHPLRPLAYAWQSYAGAHAASPASRSQPFSQSCGWRSDMNSPKYGVATFHRCADPSPSAHEGTHTTSLVHAVLGYTNSTKEMAN